MRKKCRRKIWSTRIDPIAHAIAGAAITDEQSLNKLRLGELNAIDAIVRGEGTVTHWQLLVDCMNIAETMGDNGIGPEVILKALGSQRILKWCTPVIYGSQQVIQFYRKQLELQEWSVKTIAKIEDATEDRKSTRLNSSHRL